MKKLAAIAVLLAVSFAGTSSAQRRIDVMRKDRLAGEELLYLPNERLLNSFTCGLSSVVADVLWLQCIQYTSREFRGDFKFTWLNHMLKTITRLDPYFTDVHKWGGVFLAMLKHDSDAGIDLLKSGIPHDPTSWELPFEIARTYVLNRHDEVNGALYMALAASTGNPPQFVVDWAKNLQQRHNLLDVERGMWLEIIENSGDPNMVQLAKRRLIEIDLREACAVLNAAAEAYAGQKGVHPLTIQDLVDAGLLRDLPRDPLGGTFFVNANGAVQNTTLLDSIKDERLQLLRGWIALFRERENRMPNSLEELIERGYTHGLPTHPYMDRTWRYDPGTGAVN